MVELVLFFTGLSLLLYVLLGGADFGAGIIEIFTGKQGSKAISHAIAPVWEANHIWLIVVIVILFNAFPEVYSTVTTYLHIPLLLILIGIIFRGTAFAFRYYDPFKDNTHDIYTTLFRVFSIFTPFFLGVTLGAVILGNLTTVDANAPFYNIYLNPWINLFTVAMGIFVVILFAFLAAIYLTGEPHEKQDQQRFARYAKILFPVMAASGFMVFLTANLHDLPLFRLYLNSWVSMGSVIIATILIPFIYYGLKKNLKNFLRIVVGAQTAAIITGWFGFQFPVMVAMKNSQDITVYNAVAPDRTLFLLIMALVVGLAVVIPLLIYLLRVFKFSNGEKKYM